jgi:CHAT domain-containing protein
MAQHALADKASILRSLYGLEDSRVIAAREAMAVFIPEGGTTDNCAFASIVKTEAYFRLLEKDYEESKRLYKITEDLYRTTRNSLLIKSSVNLFNNLSFIARKQGDYDEAIRFGEIATTKFDQARAMLGFDGYRRSVGGSTWRNTYADALIHPAMLKAQATDSDYTKAFEFSERYKGRALLDLLAGKPIENGETEVREKRRDSRVAQVQVRQIEQQILEEEGKGQTEQLRSLERTLSIEQTNYKRLSEDVSVAEHQVQSYTEVDANTAEELQAMAEDFTLVSYVLGGDEGLTILVLKKDGIHAWADHEIEESAIRPRVEALRKSLGIDTDTTRDLSLELSADAESLPPSDASFEDHSEYLYDLLIAPVLPYLDTKLLYISADSYLNYLPFEALKKDGRFLVEDFAVAYTPSASVLKFCLDKNRYKRETVLALGNPNLKNPAFRLVHAENEVNGIKGLFAKVDVYAGDAATEGVVKLQGVDYDVLHFACHGELNLDDPMLTSLRLAPDAENDGYLHAGEVFDCDLTASLVVLSACNSALGELTSGNELMGLTRSFLYAGVPSIVASLWMVDDRSTSFLMRQFYTNLTTMTKAEALQQAKLATMKEYPDPFHWAAFCLQGDYR